METEERTIIGNLSYHLQRSVTIKLLTIFIMMLLLLIPVQFIIELINGREALRQSAINEVSSIWAGEQIISGPVLTIPYIRQVNDDGKLKQIKQEAHILPSLANVNSVVDPMKLHRGIYEVVVYESAISITGNFDDPGVYTSLFNNDEILWGEAFLTIGITDLRGISENITVNWNETELHVEPGSRIPGIISSGITVAGIFDNIPELKEHHFSFNLELQGSRHLGFVPLGKETQISIASGWQHPGFTGSFLPKDRTVNSQGFSADWKVIELNRNYPQFWVGDQYTTDIRNSAFGVDLMLPVNEYQKSMRSTKYALLVISLTFLTFFLVEIFSGRSVHPFQYILVGLALVLFYTLLISVSEHTRFGIAYLIAAVSVTSITGLYAKAILKSINQALLLVLVMGLSYTFIYIVLQLQDYALLIGSIGLTVALAITMYITRHVDWYNLNTENKTQSTLK